MLTEQQIELRKKGIGGSEAAAVLGLSPYTTPLQVYLQKRGEIDVPQNEAMLWGSLKEPIIRQQYAERTGRVVRTPEMLFHKQYPFILGNVDGVTDDGRLVEIKTARMPDGWGESGSDEIPQPYFIQVQHYLAVTELPVADVAVLIGSADFRMYEIEADKEMQDLIIEGEVKFWENFLKQIPPEPISYKEVVEKFGKFSKSNFVEGDEKCAAAAKKLKELSEMQKAIEAQQEELKAQLMKFMAENEAITYRGKPLVTWKMAKAPERFNQSAFKEAHADLYQKFVISGTPSRRFLVK
jgi:putative phage-type endonuclease